MEVKHTRGKSGHCLFESWDEREEIFGSLLLNCDRLVRVDRAMGSWVQMCDQSVKLLIQILVSGS